MKTASSLTELRRMKQQDLLEEAAQLRNSVAKMRMDLHLGKEKDSARYKREKKHLARVLTIISMTSPSSMTSPPRSPSAS